MIYVHTGLPTVHTLPGRPESPQLLTQISCSCCVSSIVVSSRVFHQKTLSHLSSFRRLNLHVLLCLCVRVRMQIHRWFRSSRTTSRSTRRRTFWCSVSTRRIRPRSRLSGGSGTGRRSSWRTRPPVTRVARPSRRPCWSRTRPGTTSGRTPASCPTPSGPTCPITRFMSMFYVCKKKHSISNNNNGGRENIFTFNPSLSGSLGVR